LIADFGLKTNSKSAIRNPKLHHIKSYLRCPKQFLTMISRRNIRVKVMQTLYTMTALDKEVKSGEPQKTLQSHFNQSRSLLIYLTWFLAEIARYAETEAHKRAAKHLPTKDDLNVNIKIAGNELLWKMLEDPALKEQFKKENPEQYLLKGQGDDNELIKRIHHELSETAEYKKYIATPAREKQEEKKDP
jgi:transcription antitermination protein NusB